MLTAVLARLLGTDMCLGSHVLARASKPSLTKMQEMALDMAEITKARILKSPLYCVCAFT